MAGTYRTLVLMVWLWCFTVFSAPPPPVSISGSLVWTNDPALATNMGTLYAIRPVDSTNLIYSGVADVAEILSVRKPNALTVQIGGGEIQFFSEDTNNTGHQAIDTYGYSNGGVDLVGVIAFKLDGTYGDCLLIDPKQDNASFPFKFSSSTNNVIAAGATLFVVQNAHTNQVLILGNGTLESTALAVKTNYLAANFTPIPGYTFFVGSNNAVYSVSMTKTNLIAAP